MNRPGYLALRPLRSDLVSRSGVAVQLLNDDGTLGAAEVRDFESIDMEIWAGQFLADVDAFISWRYFSVAFKTFQWVTWVTVFLARKELARAIAKGLDYVLDVQASELGSPGLQSARDALSPRLSQTLSDGYAVAAIVCVDDRAQCLRHSAESDAGRTVNLGNANVSLPVREYPALPILQEHSAQATRLKPTSYAKSRQWDYVVAYRHDSKAADRLNLTIRFNPTIVARNVPVKRNEDSKLFVALAQYVSITTQLWAILNDASRPGAVDAPRLKNAMQTFAELVGKIAKQWEDHWLLFRLDAARKSTKQPEQTVRFTQSLEARYEPARRKAYYRYLHLQRVPGECPCKWPLMSVILADGSKIALKRGRYSPHGRRYTMPEDVEALRSLGFEMRFRALDMAAFQGARTGIRVTRNADLCDDVATRPAFVYETPDFTLDTIAVPMLAPFDPIELGTWNWQPDGNPLNVVFNSILATDTGKTLIGCCIEYEYAVAASTAPLQSMWASIPVLLLQPVQATRATFLDLLDAIQAWFDREQPAMQRARWAVNIKVYANQPVPCELLNVRFVSAMT